MPKSARACAGDATKARGAHMPAQTWAWHPTATRKKAAKRDRMDDPSGVMVGFQDEELFSEPIIVIR